MKKKTIELLRNEAKNHKSDMAVDDLYDIYYQNGRRDMARDILKLEDIPFMRGKDK